jgi:hypothetical protein
MLLARNYMVTNSNTADSALTAPVSDRRAGPAAPSFPRARSAGARPPGTNLSNAPSAHRRPSRLRCRHRIASPGPPLVSPAASKGSPPANIWEGDRSRSGSRAHDVIEVAAVIRCCRCIKRRARLGLTSSPAGEQVGTLRLVSWLRQRNKVHRWLPLRVRLAERREWTRLFLF